MARFFMIFLMIMVIGCDDSSGFYIDNECSDEEVSVIMKGISKIHSVVGYDVVDVIGRADASDHVVDDERNMFVCDREETPGLLGMWMSSNGGSNDDIVLFTGEMEDHDWLLVTVMHELGHLYRGDREHSEDKDSVMYYQMGDEPMSDYVGSDFVFLTGE